MHFTQPSKEVIARTITEPLLSRAQLPGNAGVRRALAWSLENRDVRFPEQHPLKAVESIPEWDNTYALSRSALQWLWARLHKKAPRTILEFGSGRTTFAMATYAKARQQEGLQTPIIVSIEAETQWLTQTEQHLAEHGLEKFVTLVNAPAKTDTQNHGYDLTGISLEDLFQKQPIEIVLIDGPCGGQGRRGTLPSIYHLLSSQADVLLDDCDRTPEQETMGIWESDYPHELHNRGILPTVGGLGWLQRRAS